MITNDNISANDGFSRFAALVQAIAFTSKTNEKTILLTDYLRTANESDKLWLLALFTGRQPKRIASGALLRTWCSEITGVSPWLLSECYSTVGDLAETIALLLPEGNTTGMHESLTEIMMKIVSLYGEPDELKRAYITGMWMRMDVSERFVFNKLLTGNFRIGVSGKTVVNAVAKFTDMPASVVAHKISGQWSPLQYSFSSLLSEGGAVDFSKPYPFYLAYALNVEPEQLGLTSEWQAEWKWDGIRGQIIKRNNDLFVWSRGDELLTDKFPEYFILKDLLPDGTVIDGEIIAMADGVILPFAKLQTRIGRKQISKKILQDAPVGFIAYDLLEWNGQDYRDKSLAERRAVLSELIGRLNLPFIQISKVVAFEAWDELAASKTESRANNAEGLMLKRKSSAYGAGRKTGDWWKWKIDPLVIDAVMVYAQKGAGRRSNLYTDYTFAVRDGDQLVTFTKAYSGLTDEEFKKVDAFVKRNSLEKFGPVRTVKPELVFEIAFEGIAASKRHKSGVALRFPRISRWRHDKTVEDINTLADLQEMLKLYGKDEERGAGAIA